MARKSLQHRLQLGQCCVQLGEVMHDRVPDQGRHSLVVVVVREEVAEPNRINPRAPRGKNDQIHLAAEVAERFADRDERPLAGVAGIGFVGFTP